MAAASRPCHGRACSAGRDGGRGGSQHANRAKHRARSSAAAARSSPGAAARSSPGAAARSSPGAAARSSPGAAARSSPGAAARSPGAATCRRLTRAATWRAGAGACQWRQQFPGARTRRDDELRSVADPIEFAGQQQQADKRHAPVNERAAGSVAQCQPGVSGGAIADFSRSSRSAGQYGDPSPQRQHRSYRRRWLDH